MEKPRLQIAPEPSGDTNARRGEAAAPLMAGKRGLVMGVANDRSIAWGIAKALHAEGAERAFTYQGEAFEKRVVLCVFGEEVERAYRQALGDQ